MDKIVAFCMRCFSNSAVPVTKNINFCHYCGSEGTCIAIEEDKSEYLREQIHERIKLANKA